MICQFCKQDVPNPCHNAHQVRERAASHVERCEQALKRQQSGAAGAHYGWNEIVAQNCCAAFFAPRPMREHSSYWML
jgi:hypothetical protein